MTIIHEKSRQPGSTIKDRLAAGKKLREKVPRSSHSRWVPPKNRADPVELLKESDCGRLPALLPIRYARMRESPFAFYRGAAALMAADLASTPVTGIRVQACGDCHAANFGGFGTPERQLVFDINDFDETLPAPWEWDVKRLAASIVLAMREAGVAEHRCSDAALTAPESYRKHMREYAGMTALEVWYSHLSADLFIRNAETPEARKRWQKLEAKAALKIRRDTNSRKSRRCGMAASESSIALLLFITPANMPALGKRVRQMFQRYRETLPEERRIASRSLRACRCRPQGRGSGQRRDALYGCVVDGGTARSPLVAMQGGSRLSARSLCGKEPICKSRRASRHRAANAAIRQ